MDYKKILSDILEKQKSQDKWHDSYFEKMKLIPLTQRGTVGELFIQKILNNFDIPVDIPPNRNQSPWDIKINQITFEIKIATEDTSNNFQFNHIRYHREYDAVICIGISPNDIFFGIWSKADIATGKAGNLVTMEKGANASFKLTKTQNSLKPISEFKISLNNFLDKPL